MRKPFRSAMFVVLALSFVLAWVFRPREPMSQGQLLSYWVDRLWASEARTAIREIGLTAVPVLVAKLRSDDSQEEKLYRRLWPKLPANLQRRLRPPRQQENWEVKLMSPEGRALCEAGPAALSRLCQACRGADYATRYAIDFAVKVNGPKADSSVVPNLVRLLKDRDIQVRTEAAVALGQMRADLSSYAAAAVPILTRLMNDADPFVREEASFALWRFNHNTNTVSFLITELEHASNKACGLKILSHFQQMGKTAKPALPIISNVLNRSTQLRMLAPIVTNLDRVQFGGIAHDQ